MTDFSQWVSSLNIVHPMRTLVRRQDKNFKRGNHADSSLQRHLPVEGLWQLQLQAPLSDIVSGPSVRQRPSPALALPWRRATYLDVSHSSLGTASTVTSFPEPPNKPDSLTLCLCSACGHTCGIFRRSQLTVKVPFFIGKWSKAFEAAHCGRQWLPPRLLPLSPPAGHCLSACLTYFILE